MTAALRSAVFPESPRDNSRQLDKQYIHGTVRTTPEWLRSPIEPTWFSYIFPTFTFGKEPSAIDTTTMR